MLKNMKHRLCRLLCLALLLCLPLPAYATGITVGGGTNAEQGGTGEEAAYQPSTLEERYGKPNRVKGLTLTLEEAEYIEGHALLTLKFRNRTRHAYQYGLPYFLEKRGTDGKWYAVPAGKGNYVWPMIGMVILPGRRAEFEIDLRAPAFYDVPGPGEYRIAKVADRVDREADKVLLTVEFTVAGEKTLYATEPVYFRTSPGTKHEAVYELKTGEACKQIAKNGKWMQVELTDGRRGYVFAKYLTEDTATQYYMHPLIVPLGAGNIRSISATDDPANDRSIQNLGGAVLKGRAGTCVHVTLKRAYDCYAVRLYLFGNAWEAQAAANALKRIDTMVPDAPSYTYYRMGNAIVEWRAESWYDFSKKERAYAEAVNGAFAELCGLAIVYLNG
ncbi:MAG: SH3 domain-containing protein [Christensenella sp.]|jgi:hypothetical protein|nr:SH3 domain-containing protein [Christensenella sp.]